MSNVYDIAYDLEKAIRNSGDFQELKKAYDEVNADADTKKLFEEFRDIQLALQQKQMTGEEITEEEVQQAQSVFANVQQNEIISKLMAAEQRMSMIVAEMNKIITKPLEELYGPMVENN